MLEKGCPRDACGACSGGPKFPRSVVFYGCAQDKSFCAVFSVGTAFVWFVVNQWFHANGDKAMSLLILVFVDMCICQYVRMCPRLSKKKELPFDLWEKLTP